MRHHETVDEINNQPAVHISSVALTLDGSSKPGTGPVPWLSAHSVLGGPGGQREKMNRNTERDRPAAEKEGKEEALTCRRKKTKTPTTKEPQKPSTLERESVCVW